jgi:3-hydroxy-D-aspartate aldolase
LVEIDCGAGRGGVPTSTDALSLAKAIDAAPNLKFSGIQSYQGNAQHIKQFADRKASLLVAGDAIHLALGGGLIRMVSGC